ncbi:MAG TPA: peptide chain release factor N(5)-glutamine methyltransferase [Arachidicoccus sp.]
MNILQAQNLSAEKLKSIYNMRESSAMTDWLLEEVTGLKRIDRLVQKEKKLSDEQQDLLKKYLQQLLQHRPIQYVLGFTYFMGMKFFVDENVLIPRPETEELVDFIFETISANTSSVSVLDIGTGSGIIPVSIKNKFPAAQLSALDISSGALNISRQNAIQNRTEIHLYEIDFLNESEWGKLNLFDIIVSNPPYIRQTEKNSMEKNVLDYEPHSALFVPDEDPLLFYKKIVQFAQTHLNENGYLFFEINEAFGNEIVELLQENKFQNITLKKDFQQKDRMVKCMFKK